MTSLALLEEALGVLSGIELRVLEEAHQVRVCHGLEPSLVLSAGRHLCRCVPRVPRGGLLRTRHTEKKKKGGIAENVEMHTPICTQVTEPQCVFFFLRKLATFTDLETKGAGA